MNKSIDDLLLYPFVKSGFFLFAADVGFIKMTLGKFLSRSNRQTHLKRFVELGKNPKSSN